MKTLLLLNSSMVVKKPYFSRDYIKIEYGNKRINSYVDGFINLQKLEIYKMFDETILIDNTISSTKNVPDQIIKLLPKNTIFLVNKNNTLGRTNKGAGMLKSLEKNVTFFQDYDLIFYFEPRLILGRKRHTPLARIHPNRFLEKLFFQHADFNTSAGCWEDQGHLKKTQNQRFGFENRDFRALQHTNRTARTRRLFSIAPSLPPSPYLAKHRRTSLKNCSFV